MSDLLPFLLLALVGALMFAARNGGQQLQLGIESILGWVGGRLRSSLPDYVDVETVDDERTFVMKDGSLMTVLKVHGTYQLVGEEEFAHIDHTLARNFTAYLKSGGHEVQAVYNDDPDSIDRVIRETLRPSMETAKRLQLDLDDLFEEDVKTLRKYCSAESVYLILITRPAALSAVERKQDIQAKLELLKANPIPDMRDSPNLFAAMRSLRTRHGSFVDQMLGDLKMLRIDSEAMEVHEAAREMRYSADPDWTDENWRACVFGDPIPARRTGKPGDASGTLWPRLDSQLIPRDAQEVDLKVVRVGDRIYAPMHITLQPSEIKPFAALFKRVRESRVQGQTMPWRISYRFGSNGLGTMTFKSIIGAILGWTSKENGLVENAIEHVRKVVHDGTRLDVTYRVDFMTWAPVGEEALLRERAARLARAVQGWGGAETSELSGDVHEAFVANCVGMSTKGVGPISCAVLDDVTPVLPLYRPASPWRKGSVIYRTDDGKPYAYQPNSPVQSSWISLVFAEMRAGKTLNANQINLGMCLAPGLVRLPLIGIVDIGRGSAGLISVLENALPASLRYLVACIRLRMTPDYAINPFDTQLGARSALPSERVFLKNMVLTLVTPPEADVPEDGMSGLAEMAIDAAYKRYGEPETAKPYVRGMAPEVDTAVNEHAVEVDESSTWWEIVDALFEQGAHHEASIAQRYAMPLLTDLAAVSRDKAFEDTYGEKKLADGEPLQKAFARRLSEAIRAFPILDRPTKFDVGLARIVSIDLDEVAKSSGSAAMKRQTAVVYMLARQVTARNFFLHTDDLAFFPPMYRSYQDQRIREIMQDKKHLQYDEFHVTQGIAAVRDQVEADMRMTGKVGVQITLISQSPNDFTPTMQQFATSKFILSRANKDIADMMAKTFSMTATTQYAVQNEIHAPNKDGSYFLGMFKTRVTTGDAVQLLRNTVGGIKLWAFSTTNEDVIVRDALYERIGPTEARKFLAKLYPGGSVLDEIERRKAAMSQTVMLSSESKSEGVINQLIEDLLTMYEESTRMKAAA